MRQPSLFDFKPTEKLRNSGFTPQEERELVLFCLTDDYPRQHVVERTGTTYYLRGPHAARRLLKGLRYATAGIREAITSPNKRF